jgi:protein SMG7
MKVSEDDRVDAAAAGVEKPAISSCHLTLIFLSDLSRYRSLLRHQNRKFDSALTYYGLANDLVPASGYGHHQMGIIFLEEKKHLYIVYLFYRALAADQPHPNAAKNLELEFRHLMRPATPRAQSPLDALQAWFVRLHVHFYRGEEFPQHAELEEEVLHRFGLAIKACQFGPSLLKMILTNICAYQVAKGRIQGMSTNSPHQVGCADCFISKLDS